jgi:hypothetical protein
VFESGSGTILSHESSTKPASIAGSDVDADDDIEGDKEISVISHTADKSKSSKKRNYWNQPSDDILNLGQQRNEILRDRMERKYKHLDKKAEAKIEIARFEAETKKELECSRLEAETKKEITRMHLKIEKIKLERERIRLEAAKLNLTTNLPNLDIEEEKEDKSDEEE